MKNNYKSSHVNNLECIFCGSTNLINSVKYYLESCDFLQDQRWYREKIKEVKYEYLFGTLEEQVKVAKMWLKIREHRNSFVNTRPGD